MTSKDWDALALRIADDIAREKFKAGIEQDDTAKDYVLEFARRLRAAWQAEQNAAGQDGSKTSPIVAQATENIPAGLQPATDRVKLERSVPAAPIQAEPVAWIATHENGAIKHFAKADGWVVLPVLENHDRIAAPPAAPADMVMVPRAKLELLANGLRSSLKLWECDARLWPTADQVLKPLIEQCAAIAAERGEGK